MLKSKIPTAGDAAPGHLPHYEAEAVHVGHDERLEVAPVQGLVQHFRGHVALGTHSQVRRNVHLVSVTEGQKKKKAFNFLEYVFGVSE